MKKSNVVWGGGIHLMNNSNEIENHTVCGLHMFFYPVHIAHHFHFVENANSASNQTNHQLKMAHIPQPPQINHSQIL